MSEVSLGVYLIHAHPFVLDYLLKYDNIYCLLGDMGWMGYLISSIVMVFGIFFLCGLLEYSRQKLFVFFRVYLIEKRIADCIDSAIDYLIKCLNGDKRNA